MRIIFFTILSIFNSLPIYTQDLVVVYDGKTIYSSVALESIPELAYQNTIHRCALKIKDNRSCFSRDSLIRKSKSNRNYVTVWEKEQIYKDYKKDLWLKVSGAYEDNTGYQRNLSELVENNNFNWQTTGEKKNILGMECSKVVDDQKTAWFTNEIPIPDGPNYGIFGLPGLVLEYKFEAGHWLAVDIIFNQKEAIIPPDVQISNSESDIKISVFDLKDLESDKAIILDESSPLNKWLKFHEE